MGIFLNEESIFMESKQDDKTAISCAGKLYSHMVKYANHKEKQTKSWMNTIINNSNELIKYCSNTNNKKKLFENFDKIRSEAEKDLCIDYKIKNVNQLGFDWNLALDIEDWTDNTKIRQFLTIYAYNTDALLALENNPNRYKF